ncbi:hypothetical protein LEP1GSC035_4234 [Leptospira noguchii str. 2007001578]|uniref:Uncharacterized protein n=1 Tax=Leptospira noguchii str. 2007001578 TaxID=1049974 RepID=A0ABP2TCC3_9LEPT|nr:hypothetical protein LEP1GSC035_4234 [Leptospira noguchii str. 2007001578]
MELIVLFLKNNLPLNFRKIVSSFNDPVTFAGFLSYHFFTNLYIINI